MALCFRFTSSTFSAILSMKPRISSTCGPRLSGGESRERASPAEGLPRGGPEVGARLQIGGVCGGGAPRILLDWSGGGRSGQPQTWLPSETQSIHPPKGLINGLL